jgi:protein TonB
MKGIRLGGFGIAIAIHGGLLATVLSVDEVLHSGGGVRASSMALAINYQPIVISDNAELSEETSAATVNQLAKKSKPTSKPLIAKLEKISMPVANGKPAGSVNTPAAITPVAIPVESEPLGIHELVVTDAVFSESPAPPQYPGLARKRGQQGTVWIDVVLDNDGKQLGIDIFQSSGVRQLDRAALVAVQKWKFIPHQVNSISVASRLRIPVEFSLD